MGENQITRILQAITDGDQQASDQLVPRVYDELRRIARAQMAREAPGQTLQPTALVHEAYIRLVGDENPIWENRAHFFAAAAEAMRRILIERARSRSRLKRGQNPHRVDLNATMLSTEPDPDEMLTLDAALKRLNAKDPVMCKVVELRYFGGLTGEEIAKMLETSPRNVDRIWASARAWLGREMGSRKGEKG